MTDALGLYCTLAGCTMSWYALAVYVGRIWGKPYSAWGLHIGDAWRGLTGAALLVVGVLL